MEWLMLRIGVQSEKKYAQKKYVVLNLLEVMVLIIRSLYALLCELVRKTAFHNS